MVAGDGSNSTPGGGGQLHQFHSAGFVGDGHHRPGGAQADPRPVGNEPWHRDADLGPKTQISHREAWRWTALTPGKHSAIDTIRAVATRQGDVLVPFIDVDPLMTLGRTTTP